MEGGEGDVLRPAQGDAVNLWVIYMAGIDLVSLPNSQSLTEGINSILFRSQLYDPVRVYEFGYSTKNNITKSLRKPTLPENRKYKIVNTTNWRVFMHTFER
jgi:hypothetical protein